MSSADQPRRPADAYFTMEELLGEGYFFQPLPQHGVILEVAAASDRCITQWALTAEHASNIVPDLRLDRRIATATATKF